MRRLRSQLKKRQFHLAHFYDADFLFPDVRAIPFRSHDGVAASLVRAVHSLGAVAYHAHDAFHHYDDFYYLIVQSAAAHH